MLDSSYPPGAASGLPEGIPAASPAAGPAGVRQTGGSTTLAQPGPFLVDRPYLTLYDP